MGREGKERKKNLVRCCQFLAEGLELLPGLNILATCCEMWPGDSHVIDFQLWLSFPEHMPALSLLHVACVFIQGILPAQSVLLQVSLVTQVDILLPKTAAAWCAETLEAFLVTCLMFCSRPPKASLYVQTLGC